MRAQARLEQFIKVLHTMKNISNNRDIQKLFVARLEQFIKV